MSFDLLAPHYRWMEIVLAGEKLQRCRTAFLDRAIGAQKAIILGEGNGRFLIELLRVNPTIQITCLDSSARMLALARERVIQKHADISRVSFVCADALTCKLPREEFDLIVTHFFLDCFRADQLQLLATNLAASARPEARWLLSDFCEPTAPGWRRLRARWILKSMYLFFRVFTSLPAREVTPPDGYLHQSGFRLVGRRTSELGLLHSDLWLTA